MIKCQIYKIKMMKKKEKFLLKDLLFNESKIDYLFSMLNKKIIFDNKEKKEKILLKFPDLELKQRISYICDVLEEILPTDYITSLDIILEILPKELDLSKNDDDFWDFIFSVFWEYILRNGLKKIYLKKSLNWLYELTKRFSMEFYIRQFINHFESETMYFLEKLSLEDNYHLRRFACEWTRPKLPWASKINLDYKKTEKILDNLYFDKTRYVTRSLANHLNDISKIDPGYVINKLTNWKKTWKQDKKEMDFIIKHSLRNLIKSGNQDALKLVWIKEASISDFFFQIKNPTISIWEKLHFDISINSQKQQSIIIDYGVYFLLKNGKYSKKVYKIWKYDLDKEKLQKTKSHLFDHFSTRTLYRWIHYIEIKVNGKIYDKKSFEII